MDSGPGADARAATVTVPAQVTLTLSATAGTMTSTGPVSITAFATTVGMQQQGTAGQFDSVFGRVEFPFTPAPTNFTVAVTHATLATFSGTAADLQRGVVSAGHHLSANDARGGGGAGGVALNLQAGLSVTWTGHPAPAQCGACVLLVEPGVLTVGGSAARAASVAQLLPLWAQSTLRLTPPAPFPFRSISDATGQESWAFLNSLVATLDAPRTVNNARGHGSPAPR